MEAKFYISKVSSYAGNETISRKEKVEDEAFFSELKEKIDALLHTNRNPMTSECFVDVSEDLFNGEKVTVLDRIFEIIKKPKTQEDESN